MATLPSYAHLTAVCGVVMTSIAYLPTYLLKLGDVMDHDVRARLPKVSTYLLD